MATTVHNFPSDGVNVAVGTGSVANNGTISTGLPQVDGFIATSAAADCVFSFASASGGDVTVGVYVAGSASASTRTIYWKAWSNKKV